MDKQPVEIWKPVVGWEDFYEVSSFGKVRSLVRMSDVNGGKRRMGGKILNPSINKHGYLRLSLSANGRIASVSVHKLVLMAFKPRPSPMHMSRHLNDIKADNHLDNLEWGTHAENMQDREKHGMTAKGERHGNSRLTNEQVIYIYNSSEGCADLGRNYGVSRSRICDIRHGRTYRSVTGFVPPSRPRRSRSG